MPVSLTAAYTVALSPGATASSSRTWPGSPGSRRDQVAPWSALANTAPRSVPAYRVAPASPSTASVFTQAMSGPAGRHRPKAVWAAAGAAAAASASTPIAQIRPVPACADPLPGSPDLSRCNAGACAT